jgi:hypothetical protein
MGSGEYKIRLDPLPICGGTYGSDAQVTGLGTPDFQKLQDICGKD